MCTSIRQDGAAWWCETISGKRNARGTQAISAAGIGHLDSAGIMKDPLAKSGAAGLRYRPGRASIALPDEARCNNVRKGSSCSGVPCMRCLGCGLGGACRDAGHRTRDWESSDD